MRTILAYVPLHPLINNSPSVQDELKLPQNLEKLKTFFNKKLK